MNTDLASNRVAHQRFDTTSVALIEGAIPIKIPDVVRQADYKENIKLVIVQYAARTERIVPASRCATHICFLYTASLQALSIIYATAIKFAGMRRASLQSPADIPMLR